MNNKEIYNKEIFELGDRPELVEEVSKLIKRIEQLENDKYEKIEGSGFSINKIDLLLKQLDIWKELVSDLIKREALKELGCRVYDREKRDE